MRQPEKAFTLAEILVSITLLALLILMVSRLVNSASTIATLGNKRMDADSQVRPVLDRIGVDFTQMIKRTDVDYYVKSNVDPEIGNDRIAFFCNAGGYYPSTGPSPSSISLVSYRIYAPSPTPSPCPNCNKMERMGKGLKWNSISSSDKPFLFGLTAIVNNWVAATDSSTVDPDYELVAPQVFRFEYFYLLKNGAISDLSGADGMQDVAAIAVTIATIDPKSRVLLSNDQIGTLIGRLKDFDPAQPIYDLTTSWQSALDATIDMPRVAIAGVRIYQRYFYLTPAK